jgi:predicted TPR repeat methyltransferase
LVQPAKLFCPAGRFFTSSAVSCRSEARTVLQQAAQQPGSHRVASLYALALINAEGGHYDSAVSRAQEALEAAEAAEAQQQQQLQRLGGGEQPSAGVPSALIVALLALLLSAR